MMERFRSLVRDTAGTITIEVALIAPIFAAMLIGLVDLSTIYSDKLRLEQIAQRSVEKVQQSGFTVIQETTLEAEAVAEGGTGTTADLTYWLTCNGVKQTGSTAYVAGCSTGQAYARYIQIDVQRTVTPIIAAKFGGNTTGTYPVHGIAGIRIQ